jgi:hypothetical protein
VKIEYPQGIWADVGEVRGVRVGQDGQWTYNPHRDLIGGHPASVWWTSLNDDLIYAFGEAASLQVNIGRAGFEGWSDPFADVNVVLDGATDAEGDATTGPTGYFSGKFRDAQGDRQQVAAGDHISSPSLASDADWIVPEIELTADTLTDEVVGSCENTGTLSETAIVDLYRSGHRRGWVLLFTEDGTFEFDFAKAGSFLADPANVKHGDRLVVSCMLSTGDWVSQTFMVP